MGFSCTLQCFLPISKNGIFCHQSGVAALDLACLVRGVSPIQLLLDGNITIVSGLQELQSLFKGLATITKDHWYDKGCCWCQTALCCILCTVTMSDSSLLHTVHGDNVRHISVAYYSVCARWRCQTALCRIPLSLCTMTMSDSSLLPTTQSVHHDNVRQLSVAYHSVCARWRCRTDLCCIPLSLYTVRILKEKKDYR